MTRRRSVAVLVAAASVVVAVAALSACAPEEGSAAPTTPVTASISPSASMSPTATGSTPVPTGTDAPVAIPTDCRAILSGAVQAQLADIALNDPAFAPNGVQADGSLICVWGDPGANTTRLVTTISSVARGPALDMLNGLATTQGFTCYTPDGGTRCEKTWQNATYPVTDGRTLFWRQGVLVDTQYSNLAPTGYTATIVEHVFG